MVEPDRLLLVWQRRDEASPDRTRRVVGEVTRDLAGGAVVLNYLPGSVDYDAALATGFLGYPAFRLKQKTHTQGVLEAFMRRLPPAKRGDFATYLQNHWLPYPWPLSSFALLGYTGAKLPGDGFTLAPVFASHQVPCDYVMEVAGTRYTAAQTNTLALGDALTLEADPDNPVDSHALRVKRQGVALGYVNRALLPSVQDWMAHAMVDISVVKLNGTPDRPLIYAAFRVTPKPAIVLPA